MRTVLATINCGSLSTKFHKKSVKFSQNFSQISNFNFNSDSNCSMYADQISKELQRAIQLYDTSSNFNVWFDKIRPRQGEQQEQHSYL